MSNLQHKRGGSILWQQVSRALSCTDHKHVSPAEEPSGEEEQINENLTSVIPSVALWRLRAFPLWSPCSANWCIPAGPLKFRVTSWCGGVHSSISDSWRSPDVKLYSGGLPLKQKTSLLEKWWWAMALWKKWWGIIKINNTTRTWWPLMAFWSSHKNHVNISWNHLTGKSTGTRSSSENICRPNFHNIFSIFIFWNAFFDKLFRFGCIPHVYLLYPEIFGMTKCEPVIGKMSSRDCCMNSDMWSSRIHQE